MTTFILLEYYKLESRGRFILLILYSEQKIQIQKSQILQIVSLESRLLIADSWLLMSKIRTAAKMFFSQARGHRDMLNAR